MLTYTQIIELTLLCLLFLLNTLPFSLPTLLSIFVPGAAFISFVFLIYALFLKPYLIFLLDYSCYKPPNHRKCNYEFSEYFVHKTMRFSHISKEFMRGIYLKSGLGNETYGPPFMFQSFDETNHDFALQESREEMFSAVDALILKTRIDPRKDIHIVIVTSGSFSPSPSLSSLLVNHYQMDPRVKTFNLTGMGCGSGALSVDMAANILRASGRNVQNALVVMTENISVNWYYGDDRSMLVTNCIFRVGCAAAIITNDPNRTQSAKFRLSHSVRTHHGNDTPSYNAAFQEDDVEGNVGISLTKDLIRVAGQNLRVHIRTLAPRVLPLSQLAQYAKSAFLTMFTRGEPSKPFVPDFTTAFEHICIHTGGKAVIQQVQQVQKVLKFEESVTEPARMALHRFGNTSSSLVFYELAYFEAKKRIKKGDRLWMLAFGTGFKVGSLVWVAVRDSEFENDNPWNDSIHRYPVLSW